MNLVRTLQRHVGSPRPSPALPAYSHLLAQMAAAEQGEGWLAACEATGRFVVLDREFIAAFAATIRAIADGPILEVCAGSGELAAALTAEGIEIIATDPDGSLGADIVRTGAREALRRYEPRAVIGSFVPFDSGVDQAVLACPHVQQYLVLNARLGGQLGDVVIWRDPGWTAAPLPDVARWMITRHDVWMGQDKPIRQCGEAWQFKRRKAKTRD